MQPPVTPDLSALRIAVLGTGANGAGIGADLVDAGLDVTYIDQWPENVQAIRERGVRVEMGGEVRAVRVRALHLCEVATLTEPFDVVLLLVKAYDTRWAVELIKPHVAPGGVVAGVQNGMTGDHIVDIMGPDRSVAAVLEVTAAMYVPGYVERHSDHSRSWFAVGSTEGFRDDFIDNLQAEKIVGGHFQCGGGIRNFSGVVPEYGGATFR